jgi:hypothetical protein
MTKTLEKFLKKHDACEDGYEFAKDLTLEQFLDTCNRGDWILWLFERTNPLDERLMTLAAGHCANSVRHLMRDERSLRAVDMAIAYGEGRATEEELEAAAEAAAAAAYAGDAVFNAAAYAADAAANAYAYAYASDAAAAAYASYASNAADEEDNQKQTADICRKYLPIEVWNQGKI